MSPKQIKELKELKEFNFYINIILKKGNVKLADVFYIRRYNIIYYLFLN